jgi:hypothetical protein
MKKLSLIVLVAVFFVSITAPAFAGGDQHHGDKGQGEVKRIQVQVKK